MELFTDNQTGHLSTTKIWQHIGNAAMTYILITLKPTIITWEYVALFVAFGAIVAGSYVAIRMIKRGIKNVSIPDDCPDVGEK